MLCNWRYFASAFNKSLLRSLAAFPSPVSAGVEAPTNPVIASFPQRPLRAGSRLELGAHGDLELFEFREHLFRPDQIRIEHRTATIHRPAVAVDPDYVDVGCPLRLAFFQDFGALVDHRIDAPRQNLVIGNWAALDALLGGKVENDLFDQRRGLRMPRLVIIVVTSAGLLSAPIHLTQDFADGR